MKVPKQVSLKHLAVIVISTILLTSFAFYVFAATPSSTFWISSGVYPGAPSYTIFKEGSNYFAKDANGQIDYSGTNASEVIQDSVDALTNGGEISILKASSSYVLSIKIQVTNDNLIISSDGATISVTGATFAFQILNCENVTIKGLHIKGDDDTGSTGIWVSTTPNKNIVIENNYIFDVGNGIVIPNSGRTEYVTIKDNIVVSCPRRAIHIENCSYTTIIDNQISDCGYEGIYIRSGKQIVVSGNIITDTPLTLEYADAIALDNDYGTLNDAIISSNTITWNENPSVTYRVDGIGVASNAHGDPESNPVYNVAITGNVIDGNHFSKMGIGIYIHIDGFSDIFDMRCVSITGNSIIGMSMGGISLGAWQSEIVGNSIYDSGWHTNGSGIRLWGYSQKAIVSGNTIVGYSQSLGTGILATSNDSLIHGNYIANWTIGYDESVVGVSSGDYNKIFDNIFEDFGTSAVNVTGLSGNSVFRSNAGFVTENSGSETGASGLVVTHGLAGTPTSVTVTATATGATDVYVGTVAANTFTITYGGGGSKTFYWDAEYKP